MVTNLRFVGYIEKNRPDYKHMQSVPLLPEDRAMMLLREESDAAIFPKFEVETWMKLVKLYETLFDRLNTCGP